MPILQMRKLRHREVRLPEFAGLRGRAGIQSIPQHCSPTIGPIYVLLFALSIMTYVLSHVKARTTEILFLIVAKYSKLMDSSLLSHSRILDTFSPNFQGSIPSPAQW